MPDALHRIVYEATVDDAVDVSLRLAGRTEAFRRQLRRTIIGVGVVGGLVVLVAWLYRLQRATWTDVATAAAGSALAGLVLAAVFRPLFLKEIRKQHRKIVAEQFRGKDTITSELELRPDALWVRQAGMEMTFPWPLCERIADNGGDIELHFSPGLSVVRNRYFASPDDRRAFLETARRLVDGASRPGQPLT